MCIWLSGTARWGNSRWSEGIGRASQDYVAVMPADHRLRGRSSAEPLLASKGPEGGIEESQEGGIEESQGRPTPEERFNVGRLMHVAKGRLGEGGTTLYLLWPLYPSACMLQLRVGWLLFSIRSSFFLQRVFAGSIKSGA